MTPNLRMEQLSLAYVRAVAAYAGYQVTRPETDVDSMDGVLMASFGRRPRIEFQAKSTTQDVLRGDELRFPLDVDNYRDLLADTLTPRILIVLHMPREEAAWLQHTNDKLCLRRCAYWISLEGWPTTPNKYTITIPIPAANVFNGQQLDELMQKAERGETLC